MTANATHKPVALKEMNAAIEMERIRLSPSKPLDTFRKITGKACKIRKRNKHTSEMICDCVVDFQEVEPIREKLKTAGIWTNSCDNRIILPKEYWS